MATEKKVMCHNSWRTVTWQQMEWIVTKKGMLWQASLTKQVLHSFVATYWHQVHQFCWNSAETVQIPQLVKILHFWLIIFSSCYPVYLPTLYNCLISCIHFLCLSSIFCMHFCFLQTLQFVPKVSCLVSVCVQNVSVQALYTCIDSWMWVIIIQITEQNHRFKRNYCLLINGNEHI